MRKTSCLVGASKKLSKAVMRRNFSGGLAFGGRGEAQQVAVGGGGEVDNGGKDDAKRRLPGDGR